MEFTGANEAVVFCGECNRETLLEVERVSAHGRGFEGGCVVDLAYGECEHCGVEITEEREVRR